MRVYRRKRRLIRERTEALKPFSLGEGGGQLRDEVGRKKGRRMGRRKGEDGTSAG